MKIAVSAQAPGMNSSVCETLCCAPYFIVYDLVTQLHYPLEHDAAHNAEQAGIEAAWKLLHEDVRIVATGRCGPGAFRVLHAAGVEIITGVKGTVRDVCDTIGHRSGHPGGHPNMREHQATHHDHSTDFFA